MPISDEALERFLDKWGSAVQVQANAAMIQAQAMTKIAETVGESAEEDKRNSFRREMALLALLASVLAAVGLASGAGVL